MTAIIPSREDNYWLLRNAQQAIVDTFPEWKPRLEERPVFHFSGEYAERNGSFFPINTFKGFLYWSVEPTYKATCLIVGSRVQHQINCVDDSTTPVITDLKTDLDAVLIFTDVNGQVVSPDIAMYRHSRHVEWRCYGDSYNAQLRFNAFPYGVSGEHFPLSVDVTCPGPKNFYAVLSQEVLWSFQPIPERVKHYVRERGYIPLEGEQLRHLRRITKGIGISRNFMSADIKFFASRFAFLIRSILKQDGDNALEQSSKVWLEQMASSDDAIFPLAGFMLFLRKCHSENKSRSADQPGYIAALLQSKADFIFLRQLLGRALSKLLAIAPERHSELVSSIEAWLRECDKKTHAPEVSDVCQALLVRLKQQHLLNGTQSDVDNFFIQLRRVLVFDDATIDQIKDAINTAQASYAAVAGSGHRQQAPSSRQRTGKRVVKQIPPSQPPSQSELESPVDDAQTSAPTLSQPQATPEKSAAAWQSVAGKKASSGVPPLRESSSPRHRNVFAILSVESGRIPRSPAIVTTASVRGTRREKLGDSSVRGKYQSVDRKTMAALSRSAPGTSAVPNPSSAGSVFSKICALFSSASAIPAPSHMPGGRRGVKSANFNTEQRRRRCWEEQQTIQRDSQQEQTAQLLKQQAWEQQQPITGLRRMHLMSTIARHDLPWYSWSVLLVRALHFMAAWWYILDKLFGTSNSIFSDEFKTIDYMLWLWTTLATLMSFCLVLYNDVAYLSSVFSQCSSRAKIAENRACVVDQYAASVTERSQLTNQHLDDALNKALGIVILCICAHKLRPVFHDEAQMGEAGQVLGSFLRLYDHITLPGFVLGANYFALKAQEKRAYFSQQVAPPEKPQRSAVSARR